ncbi:MAG: glycosyltransferase [Butyrivibrio sp.]|nr:glycosyltransferase [Acetatifactor muris]MCM1561549.1 glycosyltransferase [Butyrivibrio sp.]
MEVWSNYYVNEREPLISVIMGVYNQRNRESLRQAVFSILSQTFQELEFIIYDDGSRPEAAAYIQELREVDPRIVLIGKEENHGLAFSLNACIEHARGKYIARMDADDVSDAGRLQAQYSFMESHPEYAWCGCNARLFDENGVWGCREMPEKPDYKDYLKYSPYIHPTVMYRREIFEQDGAYKTEEEMLRCEDYEIFMRLRRHGFQGYNIQQYLFSYREDKESFQRRKMKYRVNEAKLRYRNFKAMKLLFPVGWLYVIRPVAGGLLPAGAVARLKRTEAQMHSDYLKSGAAGYEKKQLENSGSHYGNLHTDGLLLRGR